MPDKVVLSVGLINRWNSYICKNRNNKCGFDADVNDFRYSEVDFQ